MVISRCFSRITLVVARRSLACFSLAERRHNIFYDAWLFHIPQVVLYLRRSSPSEGIAITLSRFAREPLIARRAKRRAKAMQALLITDYASFLYSLDFRLIFDRMVDDAASILLSRDAFPQEDGIGI